MSQIDLDTLAKQISELLDEGQINIDGAFPKPWGHQLSISIEEVNGDPKSIFTHTTNCTVKALGITDFKDEAILLQEIEDEDAGQHYIVIGSHSAPEYSDDDYDAYFSGTLAVIDDGRLEDARREMKSQFDRSCADAAKGFIEQALAILEGLDACAMTEFLRAQKTRQFMRHMAAAA